MSRYPLSTQAPFWRRLLKPQKPPLCRKALYATRTRDPFLTMKRDQGAYLALVQEDRLYTAGRKRCLIASVWVDVVPAEYPAARSV